MYSDRHDGNSRVRNVPIHVEERDESDGDASHGLRQQHRHRQFQPYQYHRQQPPHRHEQPPPTRNQQGSSDSHTSSVNINYQSPCASLKHQQQQDQDHQQQSSRSGHQPESDHNAQDKESSSTEIERQDTCVDQEPKRAISSDPIALPPPPEPKPARAESSNGESSQQQHSSEHMEADITPAPHKDGPMGAINAEREMLRKLLEDIMAFNDTSSASKEYRRLEEIMIQSEIRLDEIQCSDKPELRQHRKVTVAMVEKCISILGKKMQLNQDVEQIIAKLV